MVLSIFGEAVSGELNLGEFGEMSGIGRWDEGEGYARESVGAWWDM